jgi:hypothetical protein
MTFPTAIGAVKWTNPLPDGRDLPRSSPPCQTSMVASFALVYRVRAASESTRAACHGSIRPDRPAPRPARRKKSSLCETERQALSTISRRERGLPDFLHVDVEPDQRRTGLKVDIELLHLERVQREDVAMRLVPCWWARAAVSWCAKIGASFERSDWQLRSVLARAVRQRAGRRWDIDNDPVPESGAGRGVGVEHCQHKALRACGRIGPRELRRHIVAAASKRVQDLSVGEGTIFQVSAR